jgi:hypothetical protein
MMWTAHKIGLFPSPVRVCGFTLMPPTVGQYQILEHLESPYLGGGRALASELYTAVLICWAPRWLGLFLVRHPKCLGTCIYFMAAGWAGLLHVVAQPRWLRPISRWLEARVGRNARGSRSRSGMRMTPSRRRPGSPRVTGCRTG